jgi:hypothetical protein
MACLFIGTVMGDRSRMTRECHVRICLGLGGKFHGATLRNGLDEADPITMSTLSIGWRPFAWCKS